jgi:hypothetical protein
MFGRKKSFDKFGVCGELSGEMSGVECRVDQFFAEKSETVALTDAQNE